MARRGYSAWGAWLLALSVAAAMIMAGRIDLTAVYRQSSWLTGGESTAEAFQTALAVMIIPGAFLAALPERIRRRGEERRRSTWQGCVTCLIAGAVMVLAAGMAGGGDGLLLTGLVQGSVSAYAFAACAWLAGFAVARLRKGRRAHE